MARADFYNPISQFIVKVTHPLLKPLRKIIPSIGRQDIASLVLAYLVQLFVLGLLFVIVPAVFFNITTLPIIALINLLETAFDLLFYLFIFNAILSWIAPDSRSPAAILIQQICYCILAPLRRFIPSIGIFDITPMIAILLLFFINNFIVRMLASYIVTGI